MNLELDQFRDVDLVIDYANYTFIEKQFVSQGDYKGRTLTVLVTNKGVVGEVPGLTLNLNWHNQASGLTDLSAFSVLDKANSIYRIEYPQHMMTPGRVIASIQVIQNGKVTNLKQFELTVQKLAGQAVGIAQQAEFSALVAVLADSNKFRTDIDALDISKVAKGETESVTSQMLSKSLLEDLKGGSIDVNINTSLIEDKAVKEEKIDDKAVVPKKIDKANLTLQSTNLFDKTKVMSGKYIDQSDGLSKPADLSSVFHSNRIPCKPNTSYVFPKILSNSGAWYDASGGYIKKLGDLSTSVIAITSPSNAYYFAWNGDASKPASDVVITEGALSDYPHYYIGYKELYDLEWFDKNLIKVNKQHVTGLSEHLNLFDKRKVTDGKYIDDSGNVADSNILSVSDFIEIDPKLSYFFSRGFSSPGYWYDSNYNTIRKIAGTSFGERESTIDRPPSNAKYVRVNCYTQNTTSGSGKNSYMIIPSITEMPTSYIPYKVDVDWLNKNSDAYTGKKIVTFGDSVTWYDNQSFNTNTTSSGKLVIGFQSYIREKLLTEVINQGVSGNTTQQIYARSKVFDYTGFSLVTFFCGINNFRDMESDTFGEVAPIGSSFDEQSFCGSYQAMIEDVIKRFPKLKICLIVPYKAWKNNGDVIMPETYRDAIIKIAKLYSIPFINLYDDVQINILNRSTFFADDPSKVSFYFHVNNDGYKLVSDIVIPALERIYISSI